MDPSPGAGGSGRWCRHSPLALGGWAPVPQRLSRPGLGNRDQRPPSGGWGAWGVARQPHLGSGVTARAPRNVYRAAVKCRGATRLAQEAFKAREWAPLASGTGKPPNPRPPTPRGSTQGLNPGHQLARAAVLPRQGRSHGCPVRLQLWSPAAASAQGGEEPTKATQLGGLVGRPQPARPAAPGGPLFPAREDGIARPSMAWGHCPQGNCPAVPCLLSPR